MKTVIHCGIVIGDDDMPRYSRITECELPFLPNEGMVLKFGEQDEVELGVGHVEYSIAKDEVTVYAGVSVDSEPDAATLASKLDSLGWAPEDPDEAE